MTDFRLLDPALSQASSFRLFHCPQCDSEVLTGMDLVGDVLTPICMECGDSLGDQDGNERWVSAEELHQLGYSLPSVVAPVTKKGCSNGQCGIQQPALEPGDFR